MLGAGNGTRTRDIQLGKLTLYQLSYARPCAVDSNTENPGRQGLSAPSQNLAHELLSYPDVNHRHHSTSPNRLSHPLPAEAGDEPHPAVFLGLGALAVPSITTPRLAGRRSGWAKRLAALATNSEEKRGLGFSLTELLIVVAIIGLIATISIPNLITAIQRSRQTRSMADLKILGRAVTLYEQDNANYPIETSLISAESLQVALNPYLGEFDATDGWRRPFMYVSDGRNYTLLSYALGGLANLPYTVGPIHRLEEDIVLSNGVFVQWPEGVHD